MEYLNFEKAFDKDKGNVGDLFQTFVFELLRLSDYPKLHRFQTAGKDGGIDLIQQLNDERTVVECKYVGDSSIEEAKRRWKTVKGHLQTHITTLVPKEKQYKPWLNSEKPVISYLFCVSSEISNQAGFDEFRDEISDFFQKLADDYSHLEHLRNIQVEILDRAKLLQKLDDFPRLKFKWFPLPLGLVPINNKSADVSFRSFLEEKSLPFYKRSSYLDKEPNAEIQSEEQLLEMLDNASLQGLIITGNGGAGKTRLTLELGRLADKKDWLVYRCSEIFNVDKLNEFAKYIANTPSDIKVLLLMDYVETQKSFTAITEHLQELNSNSNFHIKYVANCRSSYYEAIGAPNHRQIPLLNLPKLARSDNAWLEKYQSSVVRHILELGGIQIEERHLTVCKNTPIIAVFLLYLHQKNRGEELENLLQESDFGRWVQKRIKMSFAEVSDFEMKLAKLAAIFPFSKETVSLLDDFNTKLFNRLSNDRWIEKDQGSEWRNLHDVFADRIILSYIEFNPHSVEKFIRDIFALAYSTDCLESAFLSVQRLAPHLEIDFNELFNIEISKETEKWRKIRNNLLETSLLQESQKFELLSNERLWEGSESDTNFQTIFGTLIRRTVDSKTELTEIQQTNVISWLKRTLPFLSANNFLLRWALKFSPEDIKDIALSRIKSNPVDFHNYYIYSAWLKSELPASEISEYLDHWFRKHQEAVEAGFIYKSWLDAGGDIEFVKSQIERWLENHQEAIEARFVYKSWLDAGGEVEFVKSQIERWLENHQEAVEAQFVYEPWLDAGGDIEFVRSQIERWLENHQEEIETGFVYKSWLDAGGDIEFVKSQIERWLENHQEAVEAQFVYKSWLNAGGEVEFVRSQIERWLENHQEAVEARFVYEPWLNAGGDIEFVRSQIERWLEKHQVNLLADYVMRAWLDAKGDFYHIKNFAVKWLAEHHGKPEAVYLTKKLAKQKDLPIETVRHILLWCKNFPDAKDNDAIWRLTQLKIKVLNIDVAVELFDASEKIIEFLLLKDSLDYETRKQINTVFFDLFLNTGLQEPDSIKRIEEIYLKWLKHPNSFGKNLKTFPPCQTPVFLERFVLMLENNLLDITNDRLAIERFLSHFNNWFPDKRHNLQPIIKDLQVRYPSDVWEIIVCEEFGNEKEDIKSLS